MKGCQYIAGEPTASDDCKCGAPRKPGSAYCEAHHAICYIPLRSKTEAHAINRLAVFAAKIGKSVAHYVAEL